MAGLIGFTIGSSIVIPDCICGETLEFDYHPMKMVDYCNGRKTVLNCKDENCGKKYICQEGKRLEEVVNKEGL